jgi:hypothetical protein
MLDWQLGRSPTIASPGTGTAPTTVDSIKRFAGQSGVYQVLWHDGRRRRTILVAIDQWSTADQTVADAVARSSHAVGPVRVVVPPRAWR